MLSRAGFSRKPAAIRSRQALRVDRGTSADRNLARADARSRRALIKGASPCPTRARHSCRPCRLQTFSGFDRRGSAALRSEVGAVDRLGLSDGPAPQQGAQRMPVGCITPARRRAALVEHHGVAQLPKALVEVPPGTPARRSALSAMASSRSRSCCGRAWYRAPAPWPR